MPIRTWIDHRKRIIFITGYGLLKKQELLDFQKKVWDNPDIRPYSECVNLDRVTGTSGDSTQDMNEMASLAARMDLPGQESRMAIVAAKDYYYGLGRMYQAFRSISAGSTKEIGVFRTADEALAWLSASGSPATA